MTKQTFYFYSPSHFEKWDFRNIDQGIGGSETAHIECAIRLAKRGHKVISYSPLPKDTPRFWTGVEWLDLAEADFSQPGIWVIGRAPQVFDKFSKDHPNQKVWLVMQDTQYPRLTKSRSVKCDIFLPLCEQHVIVTENDHPEIKERIVKSANGIRSELIEEIAKEKIRRDPHRLMYASSPDRGLMNLLKIFPRIKEEVPDSSLHIFYGFDNIKKHMDDTTPMDRQGNTITDYMRAMNQEGVEWHGRIGQKELLREWFKTGVWAYPTSFSETSCITSMEAQACGVIPITNPFWALKDNIMTGTLIDGDPTLDTLTQMRYVKEIIYWMKYWISSSNMSVMPLIGHEVRQKFSQKARDRFNWEKVVDQYEELAQ